MVSRRVDRIRRSFPRVLTRSAHLPADPFLSLLTERASCPKSSRGQLVLAVIGYFTQQPACLLRAELEALKNHPALAAFSV